MADKASILAAWNAVLAEAQLLPGVVTPSPPPGTGVLANLAPNTARNYGTYANPHPDWVGKGQFITTDSGCAADPARNQFLLFGGSHGPSQETDIRAFNTMTGVISSLYPSTLWANMVAANLDSVLGRWIDTNQPVARHTYSHLVVRGDYLHMLAAYCNPDYLPVNAQAPVGQLPSFTGKICKYHFPTQQWTYSANTPPWYHANGSVLDPVSQCIYVVGLRTDFAPGGRIWKYDPVADAITAGPAVGIDTQPTDFAYCPDDDRFYAFSNGGVVRKITIDRANLNNCTSTLLTTTGPTAVMTRPPGTGYPSFTWDSVNKRFGGCFVNGVHFQFNPAPLLLQWTATTVQVEAGSTGVPSNDFACSAWMDDVQRYVGVQIANPGGPTTWAVRP